MKDFMKILLIGGGILLMPLFLYFYVRKPSYLTLPKIQSVEDIIQFFPTKKMDLDARAVQAMNEATKSLETIYEIDPSKRTFDNTMTPFDAAVARFNSMISLTQLLTLVSPDQELRKAAEEMLVKLQSFNIDHFSHNPQLYTACADYETRLKDPSFATQEALSKEKKYFVEQVMLDFRRNGLQLPPETQEKIKAIRKLLSEHELQFEQNISAEQRTLEVTREELAGWDDVSIDALKKSATGKYILPLDTPTNNKIFEECSVAATRKAYHDLFMNRAYPANEKELASIIDLRDQLAHLLGFPSYADLDTQNEMAKTPGTVTAFIDQVAPKAAVKVAEEMELLKKDLPEGVNLDKDGKFYPWDYTYVKNYYKKKYLAVDEALIAEYFPVAYTLPALLDIYQQFFGLKFKKVEDKHTWHEDTQLLAVYKDGMYRGTIILDIYPRPFKYTHACELTVIPPVRGSDGQINPALLTVVANFPSEKPGQPALLKRQDLIVFFHEFGHAIHAIMGATEIASFAGTNVKMDFVEMPSQMLENWMWDPVILKMVSSHYKTKEPLSIDLIEKIRALKSFDTGHFISGQLALASVALAYFLPGEHKDTAAIWKLNQQRFRGYLFFDKSSHHYAAFGHLANYGPKYYGYMWSQVYAADLFNYIKQFGLLNREIGERYTHEVIGKGGSQDPMELLVNFLGRKPNSEAFFKDLGIDNIQEKA